MSGTKMVEMVALRLDQGVHVDESVDNSRVMIPIEQYRY